MFEAKMDESSTLKKCIDAIKDLVSQVNIEANATGISLQAMDSAHISLVSFMLNESAFSSYRCDKSTTLGISLVELSKIFKMSSTDDQVTLKSDNESNFLNITFDNLKSGRTSEFQLNLINIDSESLGIPDTEYPTSIKLGSSDFFKICKELNTVADVVQFQVSDANSFCLSYKGKSGKGKIVLKSKIDEKEEGSIIIKCEEEVNSLYGLSYLNNFAKANSLSNSVEICLSSQFPMMISYDIDNVGFMKFFLAPKMEGEEN